ncbi:flagellar hook-basal body complex protein FliE [Paracoccus ravus]|uniref:flagellar hook-basal body complex protein FliE n=1 Tax=Paracoccus ravus TaxID=2447760 RepID=UPI00106E9E46|nr:flagellar hook-basal body complex protein FliE [Paracoccus ravus]
MTISPLSVNAAARAYQIAQQTPALRDGAAPAPSGPSFAELVERTAASTVETVHAGNHAAVAGLRGDMPIQQVVEATMAMESALKVTVAVRDKVVEAYQEILRMAV